LGFTRTFGAYWMYALFLLLTLAAAATAQDRAVEQLHAAGIPEAPVEPDLIRRAPDGRATIRAVRLTDPLKFDGALDDATYAALRPITDFVQNIPDHGKPASQKTEAWVLFDDDYIYVSARCWDTRPRQDWTANEMRRDMLGQQDNFGFVLDTFYDRRSGYLFYANALGARSDSYVTNEASANADFNPVWDVRTKRFEGGWTIEMQVPFKSLRYRPGTSQIWGIQLRRTVRGRNEWAFATELPIALQTMGLVRISTTPTLVGLEAPPGSRNFEVKPYAISRMTTDRIASPALVNDLTGDAGLDVKYGITQNLTIDATINTDLAQVEVDEQQVNLTRFNLLFPEKRDFFLEGRGNFDFAGQGGAPQPFFSRQIGIYRGRVVPILAGGRLTGKVGAASIGALNVQTDDEAVSGAEATNFSVLRMKQDILRRSYVGAIFTNRSRSTLVPGRASRTYGADAGFAFHDNVSLDGYYARVDTPTLAGRSESYQANVEYTPDAYGVTASHLFVGDGFRPELGFVRRSDMRRSHVTGRLSPRPASVPLVEQFEWTGALEYIENGRGVLETRIESTQFRTEFESSDSATVSAARTYDRLPAPFTIAPGTVIPAGGYTYSSARAAFSLAPSRPVAGTFSVEAGQFYDGSQTAFAYSSGRVSVTPQLSIEPSASMNKVTLPHGRFTTYLYRTRANFTFTPKMYFAGLVQYNSSTRTVGANLRLRWEYTPGSELFVVYTDDRNTEEGSARPGLLNRAFAVKITRLFRF
jgi:hypothetical protein